MRVFALCESPRCVSTRALDYDTSDHTLHSPTKGLHFHHILALPYNFLPPNQVGETAIARPQSLRFSRHEFPLSHFGFKEKPPKTHSLTPDRAQVLRRFTEIFLGRYELAKRVPN